MPPRVPVGPASIAGYLGTAALAAAAIVEGIDTSHGLKAAALSAAVLVLTNLGRQGQAARLASTGSNLLPSDQEELVAPAVAAPGAWPTVAAEPAPVRRESSAVPDGAQPASPDPMSDAPYDQEAPPA